MIINKRADLHMHSTASDGTDTPQELLKHAAESHIDIFALTDHDTMAGYFEIVGQIPPQMTMLSGVEFSCKMKDSEKAWKCHIVGLNMDPAEKTFAAALMAAKEMRVRKMYQRINALKDKRGICLSEDEVQTLMKNACPGKPHLAKLITIRHFREQGIYFDPDHCTDEQHNMYQSEFKKVISGTLNQLLADEEFMDPAEAIHAINAGGGIAVWAHPLGENKRSLLDTEEAARRVSVLKPLGLKAIECYYPIYDEQQENMLLSIAEEYGLLVSGGSDYHGSSKPNRLGILGQNDRIVTAENLTVLRSLAKKDSM